MILHITIIWVLVAKDDCMDTTRGNPALEATGGQKISHAGGTGNPLPITWDGELYRKAFDAENASGQTSTMN
jgi:hypothetical protein